MKNPNIAAMLKYYRKLNKLSVNEVSDILKNHHTEAAPKTIYGWESGRTQPDADTLMFLCELYHIDNVLETFGYQEKSVLNNSILSLTEKEKQLILQYRKNIEMQPAIDKLLQLDNIPIIVEKN